MSFDVCSLETIESLNDIFSELTSHWKGRQVTVEDAIILNDAIQDRVIRFLFSQDPNSPIFEKVALTLAEIGENPSAFFFTNRDIEHFFATPDGLFSRSRDELITQAGLRKFWKKHKRTIIVGAVAVAAIATVVAVTVATCGTGSQAAAALGSAAVSGAQAYAEDDKKKKPSKPRRNQNLTVEPPPPTYNGPLFSETGVMLNGQHFSYWEFLQKSKQEAFFTNFLSAPKPLAAKPVLPHNPPPYQPIPPQPGSSLTHRFFETFGREVLGPELIAEIPPSQLQKSHLFTTPGERRPSCRIGGVNGINTPLDFAVGHADYVRQFIPGHSIDWVYNNSHGALSDVFLEVPLNYLGASPNIAGLLTDNWVAFHEENKDNPKTRYLQLCHSQGAIHVNNALAGAPQEIRDRIIVVAIAPATVIPSSACFQSFNYASKKDIVPFGQLLFVGALDPNEVGVSRAVEAVLENRKELILLDPHPDAQGIDHDFRSPTFKKQIEDHLEDHLKRDGKYE